MRATEDIPKFVPALAAYLRVNPQACDTCEGIRMWWLSQQASPPESEVQCALDWLVAHGLMVQLLAADGRVRYRCVNPDAATLQRLEQLQHRSEDGSAH